MNNKIICLTVTNYIIYIWNLERQEKEGEDGFVGWGRGPRICEHVNLKDSPPVALLLVMQELT
jgi:hypothetical protein